MTSELRPAAEVLRDASNALLPPIRGEWKSILRMQEKAAAVIEADRQATRAALVREIVAWLRTASNGSDTTKYANVFADEIEAKWGKQ